MAHTTVIRHADWIIGWDNETASHTYLQGADIAFTNDRISFVGRGYDGPVDEEISGKNRMVMPGLIDIHCHSGDEPIAKGIFDDVGTAALWGNALYEYSSYIDSDDDGKQACQQVMLGDLMRSGVTTTLDIAGDHPTWLPTMVSSGIRSYAAPGFRQAQWKMENSHHLEYVWNDEKGYDAYLKSLEIADRARAHSSSRLDGIIAPSQVETVRPELLQEAVEAAKNRGMLLTIHAAQTMGEHEELLRRTGHTAVQYLAGLGVLGENLIIGHGIFLDHHSWTRQRTEIDLGLLADSGTSVAHCPVTFARSGMTLESVGKYQRAGINLGIGTDSYPFNMLDEMRQALICARISSRNIHDVMTRDIFNAATIGGAKALGRDDIGRLTPGAKADIVVVNLDHPTMRPVHDPVRNLILCAAERAVHQVYVDGALVVDQGTVKNFDYQAAAQELQAAQDWAIAQVPALDGKGRTVDELAPRSFPIT